MDQDLHDSFGKAKALGEIGEALASAGRHQEALDALELATAWAKMVELSAARNKALGIVTLAYARAGLVEQAKALTADSRIRGIPNVRLAQVTIHASEGNTDQAIEEALSISAPKVQARALRDVAVCKARAGQLQAGARIAEMIVSSRDKELHHISKAVLEAGGDKEFRDLLTPNAYFFGSAYVMVGLLARAYPTQAELIEQVLWSSVPADAGGADSRTMLS